MRGAAGAAWIAALLAACGPVATAGGPGCSPYLTEIRLPDELRESSGVAVSRTRPDLFWTHGDGASVLFAVDAEGSVVARMPLAHRLYDWEDLAAGPCRDGSACLYVADTGDNYEERPFAAVLRLPEPAADDRAAAEPEVFPVRFPDGPRDVEALLVLPGPRLLLVTKGRNHPVTVYRYPPPLRRDTVVLQEVQRLTDGPQIFTRHVTGGSTSPDGHVIALRTYQSLHFYELRGDTLAALDDGLVNLVPLREAQGEGVGLGPGGQVALTSEGGPGGGPGSLNLMRCKLGT